MAKISLAPFDEKLFQQTLAELDRALAGKPVRHWGAFQKAERATVADVKAARKASRLSQPQFAQALGVSPATVKAWEGGRRQARGLESKVLRVVHQEPRFLALLARA